MRAFLASSIGVACATALALPLTAHAGVPGDPAPGRAPARAEPSGSTQSLPLAPLSEGASRRSADVPGRGVPARDVRPFSLVGVVWDDPTVHLHGRVEVRTRPTGTRAWSPWRTLETHNDDAPDADSPEGRGQHARGSTAPLWVGDSDGVQARVRLEHGSIAPLPAGLRLDLVDPGGPPGRGAATPEPPTTGATSGSTANATGADDPPPLILEPEEDAERSNARPYVGPRPRIVTRAGWGADESLREPKYAYTKTIKVAFVHHTATGNSYSCDEVPSVLRGIYRYHVKSSGWRDFGYNFTVDKCGNIYEGRAGGVTRAVKGAHTLGFNSNSMGIALLGTFSNAGPSKDAVQALARLTAWKLGLFGVNPAGTTTMVSAGSNKYRKGARVRLKVISGHRDGFVTECPGARLYARLATARSSAADLQGR